MEAKLIQNNVQEFSIPPECRPIIDGIGGEMNEDLFTFTHTGIQPLGIYDETGKETTAFMVVTYIKNNGCILASIPFFYRYGYLREASFSIFRFKAGTKQDNFKIWLDGLIKTF